VLNPVVIPGLRAGICCAVLRGSLYVGAYVLSYVSSVRLSSWIKKAIIIIIIIINILSFCQFVSLSISLFVAEYHN